ncbi:MAG: GspE/PulE family protein [Bdellovibrionota bacterium]
MSKRLFGSNSSKTDKRSPKKNNNIVLNQQLGSKELVLCSTQEARDLVSYENAVKYTVLPLGLLKLGDEYCITLASETESADLASALRFMTGKKIKLIVAPKTSLIDAIFKAYQGQDSKLVQFANKLKPVTQIQLTDEFRSYANDAVSFLTYLVDYAIAKDASDIHLIPKRDGAFVSIRVDGKLLDHEQAIGSLEVLSQIINRIKVISKLDTSNKTKPQDGRFSVPTPAGEINARVSIMPTLHGEKVVLRLLGSKKILSLHELELPAKLREKLQPLLKKPEGAIILSGPTGSGKSTTLYALIHELAESGLSLVSIEDPVEHLSDFVSQTSIDTARGLDYATCLKSVLRQDPDVILLGEIRDQESAKAAFDCAATGHLLLTTVHASNVFEVLTRLSRLGVDAHSISQTVKIIISQRLLPKLCPRCKVIDLLETNKLKTTAYKAVGCSACDYSGFSGRVLAVEALIIDSNMKKAIANQSSVEKLKDLTNETNFMPLDEHLLQHLTQGLIKPTA